MASAPIRKSAEPLTEVKRRTSKTITISLPPGMAAKAEALAKREGRTMSELFREAFRKYHGNVVDTWFGELAEYGATRNPHGYVEEDIDRQIAEVRAEMEADAAGRTASKAS